ncbi:MAG: hypothetical protein GY926_11560 [bacterium]|nr:hypothetical protein [bacterium]
MPERIDIPWEWEEPDDPDVLGAWVARYPDHGAYWFVGFTRQLTFEPEDKDADWLTWYEVRGNMPGAAAPLVRNHLADESLGRTNEPYDC